MTREEFYKLTNILNSEVLGNFMHGGEADEVVVMFEEAVEHSNLLEQEDPVSKDLEKEIADIFEANYEDYLTYEEFADIAKHFFELGLKSQKGE